MGTVYTVLFHIDARDYLPFLVVGLTLWNLLAQLMQDGCTALTGVEGIIRQMPLPLTTHVLRCLLRNLALAAYSLPLVAAVFLVFRVVPGPAALLALPGLALLVSAGTAMLLLLAMLHARFRDIGPIVGTLLQLGFIISPIIWKPAMMGEYQPWLLLNPVHALVEVVRGPLLGTPPGAATWAVAAGYAALAMVLAFAMFVRFRARIAYWI